MEAPLTQNAKGYVTLDGKIFEFAPWSPSERRAAEAAARDHNREIAVAADRRKGSECSVRELRDGYYPALDPSPQAVARRIRDGSGTVTTNAPEKPSNPYRQLLTSRGHDKQWYVEMEKRADNLDRELAEKEAKILRESDPLYQRALTNAQANLKLATLDYMVPQSQIDARKAALERLQNGGPIDEFWQETIRLDAENRKISAPTEQVTPTEPTPISEVPITQIENLPIDLTVGE